jgi:hypothetical protein
MRIFPSIMAQHHSANGNSLADFRHKRFLVLCSPSRSGAKSLFSSAMGAESRDDPMRQSAIENPCASFSLQMFSAKSKFSTHKYSDMVYEDV